MLTALPALRALRHKSRVDHGVWVADFGRALLAANAPVVIDGIVNADKEVRRACFDLVVSYLDCNLAVLIERVLRLRIDNVLASSGVELCATLPAAQRATLYELALRSPYATLRADALRAMLAGGPSEEKDKLARGCLLDAKTRACAPWQDNICRNRAWTGARSTVTCWRDRSCRSLSGAPRSPRWRA
jgi:hypothetical protein